jgi:hypothetical protein
MPFAWAAGAAAIGTVAGSALQSSAASKSADKALSAQQAGLAQSRADLSPWTTSGGSANTATGDLLGINGPDAATTAMGNFQTSPGYQFSRDQGLRAVDAGAAASGLLRSGATLKAEQTFGTGLADQEFTNYYNRLFDLSKLGESAAAGSATATGSAAQGQAQTDLSLGSAQTSIYGNAAQGVGNAVQNYANNRLYDQRLATIYGGGGNVDTTSTLVPG